MESFTGGLSRFSRHEKAFLPNNPSFRRENGTVSLAGSGENCPRRLVNGYLKNEPSFSTEVPMSAAGTSSYLGSSARRPRHLPSAALPIVPAEGSDHVGVYCFLNSVFDGPCQAEFRASVEEPNYLPSDRLIARDGRRIVGHAQILRRSMRLGTIPVPVAQIDWLATAPKLQGQGLGTRLLRTAGRSMADSGALVGWVCTRSSRLFHRLGWADCGPPTPSCADAHRVLRALIEQGFRLPSRRAKFHIRPWLLWEVGSLARLYRERIEGLFGAFERSEAYWQWLVERHGFEQLYVAIDGPDLIDMDERKAPVVGYAAIKGMQIVELVAAPAKASVAPTLLARVCHDAIEAGRRNVLLHAPETEPLREVFHQARGPCAEFGPDTGETLMACVPRPLALMRLLASVLAQRAVAAGLPPEFKLTFQVGGKRYRLSFAAGRCTVATRKPAENAVRMNVPDFVRMLLGRLDWDAALAEHRIGPSTSEVELFARALFPHVPFWKPPLDELKREGDNPY